MAVIYSIIVSLKNELGHFFEYNLAFTKAAKINNFKHIKIIPKSCNIPNMDKTWQKEIYAINHKNKLKNLKNIFPFIRIFKKIKKEKNGIIFLDDFNIIILLLVFLAAIIVKPKSQLWLLHRFEYNKTFLNGKGYKIIQYLLEKAFSKKKIKFLTDSTLIKNINGYFFNRKFHVLPIPHVYFSDEKKILDKNFKYFWWPGGLIRKEKGLDHIINLVNLLENKENIKIVLAETAKEFIKSNNTIFIPTNLSRKEYESWMISSDLILLPYISNLYRYRTSGIFVEAIIAGAIPIVNKNTWMSYELSKYNLENLSIDWSNKDVVKKLNFILENNSIHNKLLSMKKDYKKIHSIENYALVLKSIL
jgi:hypothetical protein